MSSGGVTETQIRVLAAYARQVPCWGMSALRRHAQAASQASAKYTHAQCDGSKWWLLSYGHGQRAGPAIIGCMARANAKQHPSFEAPAAQAGRPQRRLINCGPPSLSCACTYTELGLARPVPIYSCPLTLRSAARGSTFDVPHPRSDPHKPRLHARQSADKLSWTSWPV
jgi:hypothetical protein